MFVRAKKRDDKIYLMLVENKRVGARTEQTVLHSLGRLDKLLEDGALDALITSLTRFSEQLAVLGAAARGEALTATTRRIGPGLIFERLWRELGVGQVIRERAAGRKFGFDLERAIFLTVLHRLFDPAATAPPKNGKRFTSAPARANWRCNIFIARWPGWANRCPWPNSAPSPTACRAAPRTPSRRHSSPAAATCSPRWTWCSSTPPRFT